MNDSTLPRGSGAVLFLSVVYAMLGMFNVIQGFVLVFEDEAYVAAQEADLVLVGDFTTWGWILILVGIIQLAVSSGVFAGALWARTVGIVMAALAALAQLPLLASARPFWSLLTIGLCIWVIHGLAVYGTERPEASAA